MDNPLRPHVLYRIYGNVDYGQKKTFPADGKRAPGPDNNHSDHPLY